MNNNWLPRVPRILIIDDEYGNSSSLRQELCEECQLTDVTDTFQETVPLQFTSSSPVQPEEPGITTKKPESYDVEVVFSSGQDKERHNDLDVVRSYVDVCKEADWNWSLILIDMNFMHGEELEPIIFGTQIIEDIVKQNPAKHLKDKQFEADLPLVMMTNIKNELDEIKEQVRKYANGYLPKTQLSTKGIRKAIEEYGLLEDIGPFCGVKRKLLIGRSVVFLNMLRKARRYGRLLKNRQILILGETGTGKSTLAKFLYEQVLYANQLKANELKYLKYQASAGNPEHEQGNLFGHWEEAYTGAESNIPGMAERAHNGVLFIDEIGNWAKDSQTHMLEYFAPDLGKMRTVRRQGSFPVKKIKDAMESLGDRAPFFNEADKTIQVQSTLITATNEHIDEVFNKEHIQFRADLFTRLIEFIPPIVIPPLRERKDDIELLFQFAMHEVSQLTSYENNEGKYELPILDSSAIAKLQENDWPGNLRELFSKALLALEFSKDWGVVTEKSLY